MIVSISLATFITALDNTVVNVALPVMQRELQLSTNDLEWIASSYILSFASLMLAGGKLTDRFGRRRIFMIGMLVFGTSSLLAGLAPNAGVLIATRAVQGVGGALALPATLAILASDATSRERVLGAGMATASAACALALGPLVGGAIAEYFHWSWIFFLNVPVVAVTVLIAAIGLPKAPPANPDGPMDVPGLVLSGLALSGLTWALIEGGVQGWNSQPILFAFAVAVLCVIAFIYAEFHTDDPLIDVALFRNRLFSGATVAQFLWGLGINGVFFFTSLFLQNIMGYSPTQAGAAFIPLAVVLVLVVPFVGRIVAMLGTDLTVAAGLLMVAIGLFWVSTVGSSGVYLDLLPALILVGVGSALSIPLTSAALTVVPEVSAGMASAVLTAAKEIAGVFGIVLTGAVLLGRQNSLVEQGSSASDAFVGGYERGLQVGALLTLVGAVVALVTMRHVPKHLRTVSDTSGRHRRLLDDVELRTGQAMQSHPLVLVSAAGPTSEIYQSEEGDS
ncbi:EmrB/QacA subfamily drug resistance transporter [Jatrophihabitans sp. GAS493]|nr:EmrB/QacA subfamily drug resistance transporter [Jatrophihabitans sp. GAS493]